MKKIKRILTDKTIYIFLLITLLFFGIFARMNFATDTYSVIGSNWTEIFNHFLLSGRMVTAGWWGLCNIIRLAPEKIYISSFIIAIICITIALYKLYKIIKNETSNSTLAIIISTIIIINPFSIELFLYIEKGIMALAILSCIMALEQFINFTEGKNKKKSIIIGILCMIVATFSYQGIVALFVALASIYSLKNLDKIKKILLNFVTMFFIYGIPAVINLLIIKIFFTNNRVSGGIILSETIQKAFAGIKLMAVTYNIYPRYLYISILIVMGIICIASVIISNKKIKQKIANIINLLIISTITVAITILPVIMQATESIWFVSRSTYTFASLAGIIALYTIIINKNSFKELKIKSKKINLEKVINGSIITVMIIFLGIQYCTFNSIEIDHYNMNYTDKENSLTIGKEIKEYEEQTGNKVTKITVYQDKNKTYTYRDIFVSGDINITGFATEWSDINMINYYNKIKLEKVENDDEIKEYFSQFDWDNFNKEQIKIAGDTLHYCKF